MAKNWDEHVNTRAYGMDGAYVENSEKIQFKSGREIRRLINSQPKKEFALMFRFDDVKYIEGKTEFQWFLYWYEKTIKSGTIPFFFLDILTQQKYKEYYTSEPQVKGQKLKYVSVSFTEC